MHYVIHVTLALCHSCNTCIKKSICSFNSTLPFPYSVWRTWFDTYIKAFLVSFSNTVSLQVDICSLSLFFPKYSQQDAQEFLIFLLDEIFQWCSQIQEKVNGLPKLVHLSLNSMNITWNSFLKGRSSFNGLFRGELTSEIYCSMCKQVNCNWPCFWREYFSISAKRSSRPICISLCSSAQ